MATLYNGNTKNNYCPVDVIRGEKKNLGRFSRKKYPPPRIYGQNDKNKLNQIITEHIFMDF